VCLAALNHLAVVQMVAATCIEPAEHTQGTEDLCCAAVPAATLGMEQHPQYQSSYLQALVGTFSGGAVDVVAFPVQASPQSLVLLLPRPTGLQEGAAELLCAESALLVRLCRCQQC
jgi:hypothetical protein